MDELEDHLSTRDNIDYLVIDPFSLAVDWAKRLDKIRRRFPQTPIAIIAVVRRSNRVLEAMRWGANGFVNKESRGEDIVDALKRIHAGETVFPVVAFHDQSNTPSAAAGRESDYLSVVDGDLDRARRLLTRRESQVMRYLATGALNEHIAADMGIALNTVRVYVSAINNKLRLANRAQASLVAARLFPDDV